MHHDPVLLAEIANIYRSISPRKYVVDATQWLGWHTRMLLDEGEEGVVVLGIDRDEANRLIAEQNLAAYRMHGHHSVDASFDQLEDILQEYGFPHIDAILYDLGVSSAHYDVWDRGFSLRHDGPLDMRFDRRSGQTAHDLIMKLDAHSLKQIFVSYADEKKAHFIAEAIVRRRQSENIDTTFKLLRLIEWVSFDKKSPLRVFQALRIAVNDEFRHIERSLTQAVEHLRIGGVIMVITFHSIEDRIVKQFFAPYLTPTIDELTGREIIPPRLEKVTKKPIIPTEQEIWQNPRSRSAKLRVLKRIS